MQISISFLHLLLHSTAVLFNHFFIRFPKKPLISTCFYIDPMLAICSSWQVSLCFGQTIWPQHGTKTDKPDPGEAVPFHGRGVGTIWSLRPLPIQTILWFHDLSSYKEYLRVKMWSVNLFPTYWHEGWSLGRDIPPEHTKTMLFLHVSSSRWINSADALIHNPTALQTAEPCEYGTVMKLAWLDICLGCFCTVLHSRGFKGFEKNHKRKVTL